MSKSIYGCSEWDNDEIMDVMFAPFRATRDINPHSWDSKMKFWCDAIINEMKNQRKTVLHNDTGQLHLLFERKQMTPVCLDIVLEEMHKSGQIKTFDSFNSSINCSWLSWSVNTFIGKPLKWSWTRLYSGDGASLCNRNFVIPSILQDMCVKVLDEYYSHSFKDDEVAIIEFNKLLDVCKDICSSSEDLDLILKQLQYDRKVILIVEGNKQFIKFADQNSPCVKNLTQIDKDIIKLKKAEEQLNEQIDTIRNEMEKLRAEAKQFLACGQKDSAKQCLRKKKKMDRLIETREIALENIDSMILKINDARDNKMIMDAYEAGSSAFKEIGKRYGLDADNIDNVLSDVQEMFDKNEEINQSFLLDPFDKNADETNCLVEELDDILLKDVKESKDHSPDLKLPDVPTFDPSESLIHHQKEDRLYKLRKELYAT